ncbi:uncharacterized protein [Rhodnius prolixus]|uniref:uncharacterized protein n=1 Tax=Rhodnius prolixus TaxID=13249 RepID=UPI003D18C2B9
MVSKNTSNSDNPSCTTVPYVPSDIRPLQLTNCLEQKDDTIATGVTTNGLFCSGAHSQAMSFNIPTPIFLLTLLPYVLLHTIFATTSSSTFKVGKYQGSLEHRGFFSA